MSQYQLEIYDHIDAIELRIRRGKTGEFATIIDESDELGSTERPKGKRGRPRKRVEEAE